MATFTAFTEILPDPSNPIGAAGQSLATGSGGVAGPGFASIQLESKNEIMRDRTNSGRLVSRSAAYHQWDISISYNRMTKAQLEPVFNFLLEKQGSLKSFYVALPQYTSQAVTNKGLSAVASAGATKLTVSSTGVLPGAMFHIEDPENSAHIKAYKVTRVETSSNYNSNDGVVASGTERIHFMPPLQRAITATTNVVLNFADPLIRVIQSSDTQNYQLDNDNLYSFSLKLEEALY